MKTPYRTGGYGSIARRSRKLQASTLSGGHTDRLRAGNNCENFSDSGDLLKGPIEGLFQKTGTGPDGFQKILKASENSIKPGTNLDVCSRQKKIAAGFSIAGSESPPIACRSVSRPFLFGSHSKWLMTRVLQKRDEKSLPVEKFCLAPEKPKAGVGFHIPPRPSLYDGPEKFRLTLLRWLPCGAYASWRRRRRGPCRAGTSWPAREWARDPGRA